MELIDDIMKELRRMKLGKSRTPYFLVKVVLEKHLPQEEVVYEDEDLIRKDCSHIYNHKSEPIKKIEKLEFDVGSIGVSTADYLLEQKINEIIDLLNKN